MTSANGLSSFTNPAALPNEEPVSDLLPATQALLSPAPHAPSLKALLAL